MSADTYAIQGLIDSHFHLSVMAAKNLDVQPILQEMMASGFAGGIDIGTEGFDITERLELLSAWPTIRVAAGFGPWSAQGELSLSALLDSALSLWRNLPIDAIGEAGLDFYWNHGTVERQKELFMRQIEISQELQLPLIIHSRDADQAMIEIIKQYHFPYGGILHCFSSSAELAEVGVASNLAISFAGSLTYKNSHALQTIAKEIPFESLLVETDSPYLAPHPKRGTLNTPLNIIHTYRFLAQLRQIELPLLVEQVRINFEGLSGTVSKRAEAVTAG